MIGIDRVLRSNLRLRHLQLLVALDEFRHLGRTAEFLSVTQPAVSKMLAEIEKTFDLQLFERSSKGTEPTPYGLTVIKFARSVLADYDRAKIEIAAVTEGSAGRVQVGAMVAATPTLLTLAVNNLKRHATKTTVLIEEGDLRRLLPRLRSGELDLIVGRLEPGYAAPDLETEALYNEPMSLICAPNHEVLKEKIIDWSLLSQQAWVVTPSWAASRTKLNQIFYKHNLHPPENIIESASFLNILMSLQTCSAIGFMAHQVAQHFEQQGLISIIPIELEIDLPPIGIITLDDREKTPTTLKLIEQLRMVKRYVNK